MTRLKRLVFAFTLIFLALNSNAQQGSTAVPLAGAVQVGLKLRDGSNFRVKLLQATIQKGSLYNTALFWGGDIGQPPGHHLVSLEVKNDKFDIPMPVSAYVDLGDVHQVSLNQTKSDVELHVTGGSTSTDYEALYTFSGGVLKQRIVRSGEFPDDHVEITSYKFPQN